MHTKYFNDLDYLNLSESIEVMNFGSLVTTLKYLTLLELDRQCLIFTKHHAKLSL